MPFTNLGWTQYSILFLQILHEHPSSPKAKFILKLTSILHQLGHASSYIQQWARLNKLEKQFTFYLTFKMFYSAYLEYKYYL